MLLPAAASVYVVCVGMPKHNCSTHSACQSPGLLTLMIDALVLMMGTGDPAVVRAPCCTTAACLPVGDIADAMLLLTSAHVTASPLAQQEQQPAGRSCLLVHLPYLPLLRQATPLITGVARPCTHSWPLFQLTGCYMPLPVGSTCTLVHWVTVWRPDKFCGTACACWVTKTHLEVTLCKP